MIAMSIIASSLIVGCSSDSSSDATTEASVQTPNGSNLVGSIVKGPIDGATMTLKESDGNVVATTTSQEGRFSFGALTLDAESYTIESSGGSYVDEATGETVEMSADQGLMITLTQSELLAIISEEAYVAITPESTIQARLVREGMSRDEAQRVINEAMVTPTSPFSIGDENDRFMVRGDFTQAFPQNQGEAFARNRAVSFSYMVNDLNLSAGQAFELISRITEDLRDGHADGVDLDDDGVYDVNITSRFGLARTRLLQDTTRRLRDGNLSEGQRAELEGMGVDISLFNNDRAGREQRLGEEVTAYLDATTLPTLHRLPVLVDEDGDLSDAKATYTLTSMQDVNVTVETPEGSWITPMWRYNNSALPVVIKTDRGNEMTLEFENRLSADSTIHWHGFKIPAIMDGGPDVPVAPNTNKTYSFTMNQPAAPLWFHPHPDMQTGKQVYMGLAGVFLLEDEITKTLEAQNQLPSGDKDTVLLVQDRRFAAESNGVRELEYMTMEMDSDGMLGDTLLVNGSVVPKQEVSNTKHRYRLYNVSNARNYDFALSDESNFTVVATDGGMLAEPVVVDHITLGAAERVEIIVDFAHYSVGDKVLLVSRPMAGDMMGMMGNAPGGSMDNRDGMGSMSSHRNQGEEGMNGDNSQEMQDGDMEDSNMNVTQNDTEMGGMEPNMNERDFGNDMQGMRENGAGMAVMRFDVSSEEVENIILYEHLDANAEINRRLSASDADNQGNERTFVMSMGGMGNGMNGGSMGSMSSAMQTNSMDNTNSSMQMNFVINGKSFDPNRIDEYVAASATEIWSIQNMSPMSHPFHAHAIQYQILDRNGVPASGTDLGWKDTFLVAPGETVRIIGKFDPVVNHGDYMYHCHILEHEDAGMMGYFRVGETGNVTAAQ